MSHHQDDRDAKRGKSTIALAVNHPREHVLIEDKTAGGFVRSHGAEQGVLVAKLHLEALKFQREAQGVGQDSIAYDLGISPRTVEVYRANLMTKMEARSLSELIRMAILAKVTPTRRTSK